jgi:hypothetical protein
MAITTGDGYIAAAKQTLSYVKTSTVTTVAAQRHGVAQVAGNPGALTLLGAATPSGGVPTDATAGYPTINAFGVGNTGYLTRVSYASTVACRLELWDKLYAVGITTAQLGTLQTLTLSSQPSISGRIPGGTDYNGLRIFVEITTTMSASATTINVTYTRGDGTTGRTAAATTGSLSGFTAGRWVELPLAAGDIGVQKIESVIIGGATNAAGALNVIIARPLWQNRVPVVGYGDINGLDKTGMVQVFENSAIVMTVVADSTSSGIPDVLFEIANG